MPLSTFIRANEEAILQEWEDFARKLQTSPDEMTNSALRDHARGMLDFIADDLDPSQDRARTAEKWRQISPRKSARSAAEAHGGDRMEWGFSIRDMVAEFRALRASVMRLWGQASERMHPEELVKFDDAIDCALAESLDAFTVGKEHETRLLEAMLSYSADQSYIFDLEGRILYANRTLAEAYGKHPKDIIGKAVDAVDPAFAAEVHHRIGQVVDTGEVYRGEFTTTTSRGDVHVVEYLFAPVLDKDGRIEAVAGNSRDITARKAWERTLWQHANHDHLTGVPNRRLFLDRLEQDIRLAKRNRGLLALLYIDLDKFKEANDSLGHDGGDLLLKQAADRIKACIRETDTIARMGGDEFTVILTGAGDESHVEAVARAILARLSRPFSIGHETVRIAGSIGIALYPEHGDTVDELTTHADQAMYAAKDAGGDGLRFFGPVDRAHQRRSQPSIAGSLRRGPH